MSPQHIAAVGNLISPPLSLAYCYIFVVVGALAGLRSSTDVGS